MRQPIASALRRYARVSAGASPLSLRGVLHVVFRRKWLILALFAVFAAAATLAIELLVKPEYEATAQILVAPADVQLQAGGRPDERIAQAIQLLTGRSLVEQVVDDIGVRVLYPDLALRIVDGDALRMAAAVRLASGLQVDANVRSSIVSLGFRHSDPQLAARVPNRLGELYIDRFLLVERNARADAFFEEQLTARARDLEESERALETFRSRHRIATSLVEERKLAAAEFATLRTSLAETQTRQGELKIQLETTMQRASHDARIPRSYYQLRERLATLEAEESEWALRFTPEHPRLRELREQIVGLRERLAGSGVDSAYGSAREQEEFNVSLQIELARLRAEFEAAASRRSALLLRVGEARERLRSLEVVDGEFNRLQARVKADEDAYRALLAKVQEQRMANSRQSERVVGIRSIEEARPPFVPIDSRKEFKLALGILASGLAAFGAAFLLHVSKARFETAEDVERVLALPVLGSIVELPSR